MKNNHLLLTSAKYSLLLLVFTPFIVDRDVFFPFIEGKTVFLRAVVALTFLFLALFLLFASRKEKQTFLTKSRKLLKNPVLLFVALFLISLAISTLFAKDSYRAFFGDVERGEGLVGYIFFTSIFFLAILLFSSREWQLFFWGVLLTGALFFFQAVLRFKETQGLDRPFATFGNPAFLAGYFLFVIFSALMLLGWGRRMSMPKKKLFSYVSFAAPCVGIILAIVGILLTQTRGTFLGLVAGIVSVLFFLAFRFLFLKFPKARLPISLALAAFALLVLGGGIFTVRQIISGGELAQTIRALPFVPAELTDRLLQAGSFQTRLIAARVSLRSIEPGNAGLLRFLVGWGPENYKIAYNTYFDPRYFLYEEVWFDRAHNRILDALVMEGAFGLLVYLGLWGSLLYVVLKPRKRPREEMRLSPEIGFSDTRRGKAVNTQTSLAGDAFVASAFIFFSVSYLVHDLFLFDTVTSNVFLFFLFAFAVFVSLSEAGGGEDERVFLGRGQEQKKGTVIAVAGSSFVQLMVYAGTAVVVFLFFWATWGPYLQMRTYIKLKTEGLPLKEFTAKLDGALYPYTYAQDRIRIDLVKSLETFEAGAGIGKLVGKSFEAMEELMLREPYEPRFPMIAGQALESVGDNIQFLQKEEEYYRKSVALVPNRPDLIYLLGQNLLVQGRFEEGKAVLDRILEVAPDVPVARFLYSAAFAAVMEKYPERDLLMFSFENMEAALGQPTMPLNDENKLGTARELYEFYLYRFYLLRDEKNFLRALVTAKKIEEKWEKGQEEAFLLGKRKMPLASKKSEEMAKLLEAFPTVGWDAVRLQGE